MRHSVHHSLFSKRVARRLFWLTAALAAAAAVTAYWTVEIHGAQRQLAEKLTE